MSAVRTASRSMNYTYPSYFHLGEDTTLQELTNSPENRAAFNDAEEEELEGIVSAFESRTEDKRSYRRPTAQTRISVINKIEKALIEEVCICVTRSKLLLTLKHSWIMEIDKRLCTAYSS